MKHKILILCILSIFLLNGCKNNSTESAADANTTQTTSNEKEEYSDDSDEINLDLTTLSSTMVYSEVYNMVLTPENYLGKTIKMNGTCSLYQDPDTQKLYYACIIQDATQCCSQGLEFELEDSKYTSDDYPNPDDEITVQGTFSTYMEDGNEYLVIKNAILIE